MQWKTKKFTRFPLLSWSGTDPAISLGNAYTRGVKIEAQSLIFDNQIIGFRNNRT